MYQDRIGQLASQHHHEMLADARRRQLRQQGRAPRTPGAASTIARRFGAAIAKAGVAAARVPDAIWPVRSHPLSETPAPR